MLCIDVPSIVATQSFLGETGALASTTIYTPSAAGLFRVSTYIEKKSGSPSVQAFLGFTDDYHTPSSTYYSLGTLVSGEYNTGGVYQANAFRSAASAAISVSTSFSGTGSYDMYVVLEQLA